jgi:hypothetical protein
MHVKFEIEYLEELDIDEKWQYAMKNQRVTIWSELI